MGRFIHRLIRMASAECGQDMVEYSLIVVAISIPVVFVAIAISPAFTTWANEVADIVRTAGP